ncbi:MAG: FAD-dependent monooxygenase, partial [Aestuariivirga sp.]
MTRNPDVIIVGAALNGLAAALALGGATARRPLEVVVVDARDPRGFASTAFDGRASAITAAARRMFEALGVWPKVAHHAEAMAEIIVTDSADPQRRPVLLSFDAEDMKGRPSAHMIETRVLYAALLADAEAAP